MPSKSSSLFLLLVLARVRTQEVTTPSAFLKPRNFNHHVHLGNLIAGLQDPEATKQGPVLFPNDAPPPPRPPLIVTSRPLSEAIRRSELNNSLAQSSQVNNVIRPYLARIKDYRPFNYVVTEAPVFKQYLKEKTYDYEERTPLPPIYKAFADHAKQKVLDVKSQNLRNRHDYEVREPEHHRHNAHYKNDVGGDDYDQNKNYAFSYTVKDHKTGDDFSHSQQSSGSATNGEYRVRLPDGRMQIVSYTADENGYQADVRYDDEDKTAGNTIDNNYNRKYSDYNDNKGHSNDYVNDKRRYNDYSQDYNDKQHFQPIAKSVDKIEYRPPANNDYYNQYSDVSNEYYNDDSSTEYESKSYDYAPHRSKFAFINNKDVNINKYAPKTNLASESTVTPSYDQLKDLLVTKDAYNTVQPYLSNIPVEINVPSTTPNYDFTTERVVHIGGKKSNLYTSVSSSVPLVSSAPLSVTPSPVTYNNFVVSSTPSSYLVSTIASLRNNVDFSGPKPVLSNSYIDRINKYLRFN